MEIEQLLLLSREEVSEEELQDNYMSNNNNNNNIINQLAMNGTEVSDDGSSVNVSQTIYIYLGLVYSLVGLTGLVANGLVLYVFTRSRQLLEGGINSLILCMALNDLMISLSLFISAFASVEKFESSTSWLLETFGCGLYGAIIGLSNFITVLTISAIVLSQFCLIYGFPTTWLTNIRTCKTIWGISFLLICPSLLGWSAFSTEGLGISCSIDWKTSEFWYNYFYIIFRLIGFLLPSLLLGATYIGIYKTGFHLESNGGITSSPPHPSNTTPVNTTVNISSNESRASVVKLTHLPNQSQHKLIQMILALLISLTVTWLPYTILNAIEQFGGSSNAVSIPQLATSLISIFVKLNVIANPIIYIVFHPYLRDLLLNKGQLEGCKNLMIPITIVDAVGGDFRRTSGAVSGSARPSINSYKNSIPNSRITPSNSICASHASFNSQHSRYHRYSQDNSRSRSGSGTSEMARSSITSGRRPTISSTNTFRQYRTNSSCSSSAASTAAAFALPSSSQIHNQHYYHFSNNGFQQTEESFPQWKQDWLARASQEMLINKFGWAIQSSRRPSSCCSSSGNSSTVFSPSRHHSKLIPKSSIQSGNGMMTKPAWFSEPDLPRLNERIIKNAGLLPLQEYKRRKTEFWRKSLFLSENCLATLCSSSKSYHHHHQHHKRISSATVLMQKSFTKDKCSSSVSRRSSKSPSPTNSANEIEKLKVGFNGVVQVSNVLTVPTTTTEITANTGKLNCSSSIFQSSSSALSHNLSNKSSMHSRSKSMRNTRSTSSKFLELPARFKRHSDGGVCSSSATSSATCNGNGTKSSPQQQQPLSNKSKSRERANSKDKIRRRESSIIMVTSPCGDTASVQLENIETNDVENRASRKFSEISSHQSSRSGKKLSFELGNKNEWKYSLIHKKECCECSLKGCHDDQYCPSFDVP